MPRRRRRRISQRKISARNEVVVDDGGDDDPSPPAGSFAASGPRLGELLLRRGSDGIVRGLTSLERAGGGAREGVKHGAAALRRSVSPRRIVDQNGSGGKEYYYDMRVPKMQQLPDGLKPMKDLSGSNFRVRKLAYASVPSPLDQTSGKHAEQRLRLRQLLANEIVLNQFLNQSLRAIRRLKAPATQRWQQEQFLKVLELLKDRAGQRLQQQQKVVKFHAENARNASRKNGSGAVPSSSATAFWLSPNIISKEMTGASLPSPIQHFEVGFFTTNGKDMSIVTPRRRESSSSSDEECQPRTPAKLPAQWEGKFGQEQASNYEDNSNLLQNASSTESPVGVDELQPPPFQDERQSFVDEPGAISLPAVQRSPSITEEAGRDESRKGNATIRVVDDGGVGDASKDEHNSNELNDSVELEWIEENHPDHIDPMEDEDRKHPPGSPPPSMSRAERELDAISASDDAEDCMEELFAKAEDMIDNYSTQGSIEALSLDDAFELLELAVRQDELDAVLAGVSVDDSAKDEYDGNELNASVELAWIEKENEHHQLDRIEKDDWKHPPEFLPPSMSKAEHELDTLSASDDVEDRFEELLVKVEDMIDNYSTQGSTDSLALDDAVELLELAVRQDSLALAKHLKANKLDCVRRELFKDRDDDESTVHTKSKTFPDATKDAESTFSAIGCHPIIAEYVIDSLDTIRGRIDGDDSDSGDSNSESSVDDVENELQERKSRHRRSLQRCRGNGRPPHRSRYKRRNHRSRSRGRGSCSPIPTTASDGRMYQVSFGPGTNIVKY